MLTREQALQILEEENTPEGVVEHAKAVARKAVNIAEKIQAAGHEVDVQLVETGALLHDIGRSQTHGFDHGYFGSLILKDRGLEQQSKIAARHIGAGVTKQEAKRNGLPSKDFIPKTLEEKIVANADNLIDGTHSCPIQDTVQKMKKHGDPEDAIERVLELYQEIEALASLI